MENGRKGKGGLAFLAEAHLLAVPAGCKTPPLYVQSGVPADARSLPGCAPGVWDPKRPLPSSAVTLT